VLKSKIEVLRTYLTSTLGARKVVKNRDPFSLKLIYILKIVVTTLGEGK